MNTTRLSRFALKKHLLFSSREPEDTLLGSGMTTLHGTLIIS
jgi:hypothetical protein